MAHVFALTESRVRILSRELGITSVRVTPQALTDMEKETRAWYPRETGGVLLGYHLEEDVHVTMIVGGGPRARHLVDSFEPDWPWQQEEVARHYQASSRTIEYLGDWHSHPRGVPRPSPKDRGAAKTIATSKDARCATPIMIIVGLRRREDRTEVRAYIYRDSRLARCELLP